MIDDCDIHTMYFIVVNKTEKYNTSKKDLWKGWKLEQLMYRKVVSSRPVYYSIFEHFGGFTNQRLAL